MCPHLIKPLLGNRMSDTKKDLRMSGLMDMAPELQMRDKDQIAALAARVAHRGGSLVGPVAPAESANCSLCVSPKEKMPFQVTPFMVYLTREQSLMHAAAEPAVTPDPSAAKARRATASRQLTAH